MGTYWYRMTLKFGTDIAEIKQLINQQAREYLIYQGSFSHTSSEDSPYSEYLSRTVRTETSPVGSDSELRNLLNILGFEIPDTNPFVEFPSWVSSRIPHRWFPPEWRLGWMQRSFLPDELRDALQHWEQHIQHVEAGKHRAYLMEYYLYCSDLNLHFLWQLLQNAASTVRDRPNGWARRIAATDLPERVLTLPEPNISPPPFWIDWEHRPDHPLDDNLQERYMQTQQQKANFDALRWEWTRQAASKHKIGQSDVIVRLEPVFEAFLDANRLKPEIDIKFRWLRRCVDEGYGLYLW